MKTKLLYIAAMALLVGFTACQNDEPFDTQSPDDAPLILKPYNESGTGSFTYQLANPDTPLFDSVTVTPSAYTTINWYLDGQKVFTGTKINMTFPAGNYALRIEAVTEKGLSTHRDGSVVVRPYDFDPYSAAPAAGRHVAPGMSVTLDGQNLDVVSRVIISQDVLGENVLKEIEPTFKTDDQITFTMPELEDGKFFLRLKDIQDRLYGADGLEVHNGSVVLAGFESFAPGDEWVLTGVNLQNVASVKVDGTTITTITTTETSVTLIAPEAEVGEHKLSMLNKDGSSVLFITSEGAVSETKTIVSEEKTIWTGPVTLDWNADLVKVTAAEMSVVPVGSTIFVYYDVPEAEYHAMRITTPWWGEDLVAQIDGMENVPSPYSFTYDDRCKNLVENNGGAMSIVGFGLNINKITFK